jgi:cellulose synthase operon protein YhjU
VKLSGLGVWNLYFLIKFVLFYYGAIKFDVLSNAALAAFLVLHFSMPLLEKLKHVIGAVLAINVLYQDSWLPPINRLLKQSDLVQEFNLGYVMELTGRVINVDLLLGLFVLIVCFWYTSQWIRFTTVTVLGLALISYQGNQQVEPVGQPVVSTHPNQQEISLNNPAAVNKSRSPNQQLNDFYQQQRQLVTHFPAQLETPFDVIILNICSMATADLNAIGVSVDTLFEDYDIVFSDFNTATSYSGPAAIRLLRASCGQTSQTALFDPAPQQCYLFDNLEKLGYSSHIAMNHDGHFDAFKELIKQHGNLTEPVFNNQSSPIMQYSFDDTPIYSDGAVLQRWLAEQGDDCAPCALYYNSISLHDGNQFANQARMNSKQSYPERHANLFADITQFINSLEQRGRNVMLMVVPEHGAALKGDRVQFAGLREIPSPAIVSVPAAIKFIGPDVPRFEQIKIAKSSSYFALSELVSGVMKSNLFAGNNNLLDIVTRLPAAPKVAENSGTIMMYINQRPYIQLDGGQWTAYPE